MKGSFAEPPEVEAAQKAGSTPYGRKIGDWRHWWRRWHIRCAPTRAPRRPLLLSGAWAGGRGRRAVLGSRAPLIPPS